MLSTISRTDTAAQIAAAHGRFLQRFAANDIAAIADCYTEDAQMLVASMDPIRGRAQIASVFKFTGGRGHTLEFQSLELDVHGTTAIEIGRYLRRQGDGAMFDRGKYLVVWKRVGGEWQIHRDMFNTSLA